MNRDLVLIAVRQNGWALLEAAKELRTDDGILRTAFLQIEAGRKPSEGQCVLHSAS